MHKFTNRPRTVGEMRMKACVGRRAAARWIFFSASWCYIEHEYIHRLPVPPHFIRVFTENFVEQKVKG
jgi:hypothetical protein